MKLYSYWRSSAAYRVRIALNYKQIPYQQVTPNLARQEQRTAEYLAVNPQGLVPALELDGEHAGKIISQSLAIIEYLESVKKNPSLFPADSLDRARVNAMAQAIACDIHPLNNQRVLRYLKDEFKQDDAAVDRWYARWICDGFVAVESWARELSADGRYLFGDAVTLADVLLVPQIYNARRFNVDLQAFPTLLSVDKYLCSLPAFAAAAPEVQPDSD